MPGGAICEPLGSRGELARDPMWIFHPPIIVSCAHVCLKEHPPLPGAEQGAFAMHPLVIHRHLIRIASYEVIIMHCPMCACSTNGHDRMQLLPGSTGLCLQTWCKDPCHRSDLSSFSRTCCINK
jgi:hypothetical protein